jgi:potassium efflux system protein
MRNVGALLLFAAVLLAQDPWDDATLDPARLKAAVAEARERQAGLPEAAAAEDKAAVAERIALLEQLLQTLDERTALLAPAEIERRKQEATAALETLRTTTPPPPEVRTTEELAPFEQRFREAEAAQTQARESAADLANRRKQAEAELAESIAREAKAKRRLEVAREEGTSPLALYRLASRGLEVRLVQERAAFLRTALDRWAARAPMQQLEIDVARLRFDRAQRALGLARDQVSKALGEQAVAEKKRAEADAARAERERDPLLRFRKRIEAEVDRLRADSKRARARAVSIAQQDAMEGAAVVRLDDELTRLRERLEGRGGASQRSARILQGTLQRTLRRRRALEERTLPGLEREITTCLGELAEVQDRRWEFADRLEESPEWQKLAAAIAPERLDEARRVYAEVVDGALAEALRERQAALDEVYGKLRGLEARYREQLARIERISGYVLSRIYWIRSDPPLGPSFLTQLFGDLRRIAAVYRDAALWTGTRAAFLRSPVGFVGACAGIVAILLAALFLAGRLRARPARDKTSLVRTVVRVVVWAACCPVVLLVAYGLVRVLGLPEPLALPLSQPLPALAGLWFARRLARGFLAADGLAVANLGMSADLARQLLRTIRIATSSAILFYLPYHVLKEPVFSLVLIPRLFYTLFEAGLLLSLFLMLLRRGALIRAWTGGEGLLHRVWGVFGPLIGVALAGILLMDVLGYRLGAARFLRNTLWTFGAVVVITLLYAGLQRLVERVAYRVRAVTAKEEGWEAAWESSRTVRGQLTRAVSVTVIVLVVVALAGFWGIGRSLTEALGSLEVASVGDGVSLTAWDILVALFWIAGGHFLVHHLSGVYEFLVFPLIGATGKGGQYVFLALSRYAILLVVYSAALVSLHFSFASVGWLLAAASVGLGFGLQEIVANFVSGLILLLERPIRVGDVISVGETGGTVEKINIRATVVTNWDRQQIIVPNKNFVTQNLINWTRNDEIMRRKVLVSVAYGSDVEKVLRLLREIVDNHPKVRKDPEPRIFFENFGESSLDFEVWLFAPVTEGKPVMTEIRTEITRRFAAEGIEIPFPQRDLHVKSAPDADTLAAMLERRRDPEPELP